MVGFDLDTSERLPVMVGGELLTFLLTFILDMIVCFLVSDEKERTACGRKGNKNLIRPKK